MKLDVAPRPVGVVEPASGREHFATVAFGLWMTVGLFLDGYFHQNLETDSESFVTPWHGMFYTGFFASALWLGSMSRRRAGTSAGWRLGFLPPGYEGTRAALVLFVAGGLGDAAWHTAFGVERGIDAVLSPTHLAIFASLLLILSAPCRAANLMQRSEMGPRPSPWIVLGSITSATALVAFFVSFAWGLDIKGFSSVVYDPVTKAGELRVIAGFAGMTLTTVVLFGAARVLVAATTVPFGACTALFGTVTALVAAAFEEDIEGVVAAIAAGLVLDGLLRLHRSHPNVPAVPGGLAAAFGIACGVLWTAYFLLIIRDVGIGWPVEIWLGGSVLHAMGAAALAVLPSPPRPATVGSSPPWGRQPQNP